MATLTVPNLEGLSTVGGVSRVAAASAQSTWHQDAGWLRGDLHSHTLHSDGLDSVEALVARARAAGLEFLAITDHDTVSHHWPMTLLSEAGLVLIPGQEVTTALGHLNVWGSIPRCDGSSQTDEGMLMVITQAHESGAVCSVNHPKTQGPPWLYTLDLPVDAVEVWQTHWPCHNRESLALWDQLLAGGRRLTAVGGSDYHGPLDPLTALRQIGCPTTWVKAGTGSVASILEGIKAGRVCLSAHPGGPRVDIRAWAGAAWAGVGETLEATPGSPLEAEIWVSDGIGCTVRVIADSFILYEGLITSSNFMLKQELHCDCYLRIEVVGDSVGPLQAVDLPPTWDRSDWRQAISNPIYVRRST